MNPKVFFTAIGMVCGICIATAQQKQWTLKECVDYALKNNISLKQAGVDVQTAQTNKQAAVGQFLPNIDGNANQRFTTGSGIDPATNSFVNNLTSRSNSFSIDASLPLFNGLKNINGARKATIDLLAQRYRLQRLQKDIQVNIMTAYLQALFARESITVTKNQVQLSQQQVTNVQNKVAEGAEPKALLAEMQATLASDQKKQVEAENNFEIAKLQISQLLQLENPTEFDVATNDINAGLVALNGTPAQAIYESSVKQYPTILQNEALVKSAEKQLNIVRSASYPSINFIAGTNTLYSSSDSRAFRTQFKDNLGYYYGLSLYMPIFRKLRGITDIKNAKLDIQNKKYQLEAEKNNLYQAITKAHTDVRLSFASYEASQKAVSSQETAFSYAKEKFDAGMINSYEFNQIKSKLAEEQSNLLRAKYDYIFKTRILDFFDKNDLVLE